MRVITEKDSLLIIVAPNSNMMLKKKCSKEIKIAILGIGMSDSNKDRALSNSLFEKCYLVLGLAIGADPKIMINTIVGKNVT